MLFSDRLEARIAECGNPICLGMDPKLSLMPVERRHSQVHTPEDKIRFFYMDILEECKAMKEEKQSGKGKFGLFFYQNLF